MSSLRFWYYLLSNEMGNVGVCFVTYQQTQMDFCVQSFFFYNEESQEKMPQEMSRFLESRERERKGRKS